MLAVLCALLLAQAPLPEGPKVGEISFEGADADAVRALVTVRPGQTLDVRGHCVGLEDVIRLDHCDLIK